MKQGDIQKMLEALGKSNITIAGDFVLEKHVEHEVNNVEAGGIGIQIVNGAEGQTSQNRQGRIANNELSSPNNSETGEKHFCESQKMALPLSQCAFAERVKAIMHKAATKNGQTIKSQSRGHLREYIYNVNADAFCKAMDELVASHKDKLKDYLGGSLENVMVTKVCNFIGYTLNLHIINDTSLQKVDLLFAFHDYYKNENTVNSKLGDKKSTDDENVLLGIFEGLLKKYVG